MKTLLRSAEDVSIACEIAAALEACGWPKPGNVHRTSDFPHTVFEHYVTGSIALGRALRLAAARGMKVDKGSLPFGYIRVGRLVKQSIDDTLRWHQGGNTHLGVAMLFVPLAAAAGATISQRGAIESDQLRRLVRKVMDGTTPADAVDLYGAISEIGGTWWGKLAGKSGPPDLCDPNAISKIKGRKMTLLQIMKYCSHWDSVACELVTGMETGFTVGYPTFIRIYSKCRNVNTATVHTFLTILSIKPDTFIARKYGLRRAPDIRTAFEIGTSKAKEVSEKARNLMELGGLLTERGRNGIHQMDKELRQSGDELNPGSTADMTASSILIALLTGFRP